MYIDDDELRGLYQTSSVEHIQAIESAVMALEKHPQNIDPVKDLLRSAHTLKGDSRMLGVEDVETLVHQIEECLMPITKGQASMTGELCDRLYTGLDTIKQLAHTAVTGEPNNVNMFYVLALLMGDGGATPTVSEKASRSIAQEDRLFDSGLLLPDLDGIESDRSVFGNAPDLWVSEKDNLSSSLPILSKPPLPLATSQLQADFLDLASSLFPPDSTLPELNSGAVFNDFVMIPGTEQPAEIDLAFPSSNDLILFASHDPNPAIEQQFGDGLPTLSEDDLFPTLDQTLLRSRQDLTLISSNDIKTEIERQFGDGLETLTEDDLFPTLDEPLLRSSQDLTLISSHDLDTAIDRKFDDGSPTFDEDDLFFTLDQSLAPHSLDPVVSQSAVEPNSPILPPIPQQSIQIPPLSPPAPTPAASVSDKQTETIRVEARQLDILMGQAAEINVIDQQIASRLPDLEALVELWEAGSRDYHQIQTLLNQLPAQSPLHRYLSRTYQQWEQMGQSINKFKQLIAGDSSRLDLVTTALESGVKKLRLLPLSTIFNLFPRMVRDLAKTQAKEINFAIEGGELLLDKRLLEEIKDPLMHLLRNAIDHGIETPAQREQQGKLPGATLLIQVRQTGNQTTIEIADDGRGLDIKRIKATAIKRGLHTEAELAAMTTTQIQSLIFASGFSTRARVTELSGRGVGLDIVRTNVERLKGSVSVNSIPDRGCTFQITLSHAIGSSQVMLVDVRDRIYAIPVEFVDRMLLLNKAEIFALGGTPTTTIAGQTITVAWLADLLSLPVAAPISPGEVTRTTNSVACLLLQSGRQQLALLVDRIRDRQLVTIESPHPVLKNVPHLTGATILGTGEVCLVLNPLDLFTTAAGGNPLAPVPIAAEPLTIAASPSLLLVEDSLVIRTQMQRILGGAGYQVTVASDGLEGWEKLQAGQFDLVVSDVEMPRWGGLELTTQIRKHAEYQDLPVILVTTLAQAADRDRGFQSGANAYLTKGDFDQQLLLDTLTRLI